MLLPAAVVRVVHRDQPADLSHRLALGDPLPGNFRLEGYLLGCVASPFHGKVIGQAWPADFLSTTILCRMVFAGKSTSYKIQFSI